MCVCVGGDCVCVGLMCEGVCGGERAGGGVARRASAREESGDGVIGCVCVDGVVGISD